MKSKAEKKTEIVDTIIGAGTTFEGKIKSEASMRVEGKVQGEINCNGDLTVGKDGVLEADVKGRNIRIAGKIIGNIIATGTVHIESNGKIQGNVKMNSFVIDEGGIFEGESKMGSTDSNTDDNQKKQKKDKK